MVVGDGRLLVEKTRDGLVRDAVRRAAVLPFMRRSCKSK